jgi:hydrogenase-4 component B
MSWAVAALLTFLMGALLCLLTTRRPALARGLGPAVAISGGILGLVPAAAALGGAAPLPLRLPWSIPFGSLSLEMDALSALFAAPILVVAALAAVYGAGYLRSVEAKRNTGVSWFFFNLLAGSMLLVVLARNAMLFLLGWETMALASFFLVMFEGEQESVRRAGWTYLVATHIGTAFLLALFVVLGRGAETLDFSGFAIAAAAPATAGAAFLFAVIGFGAKAGFMPLHVWLPEAHPAAPSHVSAVMSGVMIKTGIYGLARTLTFLGPPPPWWGWTLVGIGIVSGVLGVLFALAQHDLKRLLAYHSVENIGIIALGLGVGLLGVSYGHPAMAFLGFAGGLLHVVNHAAFKSLLFMGAGAVLHATGTREIDLLGGLLKRMPATAACFLVGSVAICGLPPLNGFVSEFLIYLGSFRALAAKSSLPLGALTACLSVVGALALIGGLAVACFTKAFGVIFLGEPRSSHAEQAHAAGPTMRIPMVVLAIVCMVIGLAAPALVGLMGPVVAVLTGGMNLQMEIAWAGDVLGNVTAVALGGLTVAGLLALLRARLLARRSVTASVTWDCGYVAPTPRMQYTASSFADPLTRLFHMFLRTHRRFEPPSGLFPVASSLTTETSDVYRERLYRPVFTAVEKFLGRFRRLQHGRLNLYVLYIVLALLALLTWKLR